MQHMEDDVPVHDAQQASTKFLKSVVNSPQELPLCNISWQSYGSQRLYLLGPRKQTICSQGTMPVTVLYSLPL